MKLELSSQYDIPGTADPILTYEKHCLKSAGCPLSTLEKLGNETSLLEENFEDDVLERKVALKPDPKALPGFVRSMVGDDATACTQIVCYNFKTHTGTTETIMDRAFVREKISISGTFSLRSAGPSNPRTIFFDSSQDIKSSVFMIGGKIEKAVVSQFSERNPEVRDLNLAWIEKEVAAEEGSENV